MSLSNFIYPAPGVANVQVTLSLITSVAQDTALNIPGLQDVTVQADNDVFTWTQLDAGSKRQIATTATNSISMNLVLDQDTFFGDGAATPVGGAANLGIFGMSQEKTKVAFSLFLGTEDDGSAGKTLSGNAYITGLSPTVSADAPVWVSPITLTVDGDYTVS